MTPCLLCGCSTRHARRTRVAVLVDECARGACWHWDHLHHYPRGGRSAAMRSQYAPAMLRGQEVPQTTLAA